MPSPTPTPPTSPQHHQTTATSSSSTTPFASRPQKYPKTQRMASQVVAQMHRLIQKGPRTLIATVIDTSFLPSMGYALCTTQLGVVNVYGIPFGTVVPNMRILARQMGPAATNRGYVFDGFAPALSSRGLSSGSLLLQNTTGDSLSVPAVTSVGGVPTSASLASAVGYYWHCFFYIPILPTLPRVTLFSLANSGATNTVSLEYLSSGSLVFRSTNDNHGYVTTGPVSPHGIHWVVIQPGMPGGSGLELLIDGVSSSYTGLQSSGDVPFYAAAGAPYTLSFLSNINGSAPCPVGTWVSKFGYGYSSASSTPVPLSLGSSIPQSDSDIPSLNAGGTLQTQTLYLCTDPPGSGSMTNNAPSGGTGSVLSPSTSYANLVAPGPY